MAAGYQNLYLEQGTSFSVSITLDDVYGDVYDLSGATVNSQIRKSYYSSNTVAVFNPSVDANNGIITLSLDWTDTSNIRAGRYLYDTTISFPGVLGAANTVIRILEGTVDVSPRISR